jgi:hypothetical protein
MPRSSGDCSRRAYRASFLAMSPFSAPHTLADSSAFAEYCRELSSWLMSHMTDEGALRRAGLALFREASARGMQPEEMLISLHMSGLREPGGVGAAAPTPESRQTRYEAALRLLMEPCFGEPMPLRLVRAADGREWLVMPIREGMRWDPEIEMRRRDWLCCVIAGDRRYISPVPVDWDEWPDDQLLLAIEEAKPDLRSPRRLS